MQIDGILLVKENTGGQYNVSVVARNYLSGFYQFGTS